MPRLPKPMSPKDDRSDRRSRRLPFFLAACLTALLVLPCPAETPCVFTGVDKIVAVGDLHGDFENFVKILLGTKLVDQDLHWTAGRTHLVQVGDILDRGPSARKIFDLLIQLEKEAERAGGRVHVLLGNHEEMALAGISFDYPGYVTLSQFLSFIPEDYLDAKQTEFIKKRMAGLPVGPEPPTIPNTEIQEYWKGLMQNDEEAQQKYFESLRSRYGPWLLGRNAVIKINDVVFVHGGISERFSKIPLEKINSDLRYELELAMRGAKFRPRIMYAPNSPLWYRDLANDEKSMTGEVDRILANLKAKRMVVGHSPHGFGTLRTMERFGGRIFVIDTGISARYGGHYSALIIENQNFVSWGVSFGAK
jgi:hypothetical protein